LDDQDKQKSVGFLVNRYFSNNSDVTRGDTNNSAGLSHLSSSYSYSSGPKGLNASCNKSKIPRLFSSTKKILEQKIHMVEENFDDGGSSSGQSMAQPSIQITPLSSH